MRERERDIYSVYVSVEDRFVSSHLFFSSSPMTTNEHLRQFLISFFSHFLPINSYLSLLIPIYFIIVLCRAGRCGRAGRKGLVTAIIAKRDKILSDAIQVKENNLKLNEIKLNEMEYCRMAFAIPCLMIFF